MYLWLEEMGLVVFPQIKSKEDFKIRFELLMRRMITERVASRLGEIKTVGGKANEP